MNAPFGVAFLKKAELYNLVRRLDRQAARDDPSSKSPSTWPAERKIFKWSYFGHKHLASPIKSEHFKSDSSHNKLSDWGLLDKGGKVIPRYRKIVNWNEKIRENMVIRGFADYQKNPAYSKDIVINKEGLLLGEVIYNAESKNFFIRLAYWVYSWLIDYVGALILLLVVTTPVIKWVIKSLASAVDLLVYLLCLILRT